MNGEAEFLFRLHNEEDVPFIHSSWGSSYYDGNPSHRILSPKEFHAFHRPIRERFLQRPGAKILVCADTNDLWHILGWVGFEELEGCSVIHYVYVKTAFKKHGIADELLKRAITRRPVLYTHSTEVAANIMAGNYSQFSDFRNMPHLV